MRDKRVASIFSRYLIVLAIGLFGIWLFYEIFKPLTIYPVYFILSIFFDASLDSSLINIGIIIEIIPACIAGSAYYLLFLLNMSVPEIKISKRVKMILFSFLSLLLINVLRIVLLSIIALSSTSLFDITHKLFWYSLSILFVALIWFIEVKIFSIKSMPLYSDLRFLFNQSLFKKH